LPRSYTRASRDAVCKTKKYDKSSANRQSTAQAIPESQTDPLAPDSQNLLRRASRTVERNAAEELVVAIRINDNNRAGALFGGNERQGVFSQVNDILDDGQRERPPVHTLWRSRYHVSRSRLILNKTHANTEHFTSRRLPGDRDIAFPFSLAAGYDDGDTWPASATVRHG
jgi:hypothetical protein